ncbi:glutamic acid-rich protein-like isoform X2 [Leptopilina heterotoma]|uniref:glutamic acid-rich protein-like isoform X2 n=1 Tax=Leptopilina heterotoma TaxID=63436 RepID=UPI001CA8F9F3|nr:glutamic acid-rich protein-like isoform X2 [Leptopilina heterotoma]
MNSQTEDTNAVKKKLFKKDDYRAFRIALDVQESDLEDFCIEMSKKKVKSPKCLLKSVFKEKNSQVEKKSSQKAEKKIDHSLTVRTEKENIKPKKNVINQPLEEIFNDEEEIIEASGEQKEIEEKKKEKKKKALNVDLDVVKKKKILKKTKKNSKNVSKEATLDVMNTTFLEENEEITNEEIANEEITDDEITKNVTKKKENVTKKKKTKGIVKSKTSEHVSTEKKKISRKSKKIPKNLQDDSNMETNEALSFEGIENYKETDNANEEVSINIKNPNSSSVALIEEGQDLQSFEEICKNIQNSSTFIEDEGEKLGEIEEEKREAEEEVEKAEIEVEQEDIEKEEKDEEIEVEQEVIEDEEEENEVEQEKRDDKKTEKVEKEKQVEQEEIEEKSDDETEKEEEEEEEAEEEIEERLSAQNEETLKIQNEDRTENETLHLPSISLEMSEPSENSEVTLNLAEKCSTPKVNQAIASTSSFSPLKEKEENYKLNEISEALAKVHISPQPTEKVKVSKREAARKRKEQRDQKKMAKAVGKINNYALKQLKKLDVDVVHPELQQYINSVQADTESSSSSDEETSDVCYCPDCDCSLLCECSCCNDSSGSSASEYSETCSCSRCQESTSSSSDSCYPVDDSSSEE